MSNKFPSDITGDAGFCEIFLDGVDIMQVKPSEIRRRVGVVLQDFHIFSGTVYDNIALGDPSMTLDEVVEAATLAQVHDDIMRMPLGYDSLLAAGGASLSGGQRQRLALARVLARKPAILVLDERCQIGRQAFGQHGKDHGRRIDGCRVDRRMPIER